MILEYIIILLAICISAFAAVYYKKLSLAGGITGVFTAFIVYLAGDLAGICMLAAFFLLAVMATSFGKRHNVSENVQEHAEKRDAKQVIANGGAAAICGIIAIAFNINGETAALLMAAAFSSAAADTVSSEIGTVFGKNFYNIINFRKDQKGRDGVISMEGTLAGIAASVVIAAIYCLFNGWSAAFIWIILAGTIGNLADSLMGATLERRGVLKNNAVNFLNTIVGIMIILVYLA